MVRQDCQLYSGNGIRGLGEIGARRGLDKVGAQGGKSGRESGRRPDLGIGVGDEDAE